MKEVIFFATLLTMIGGCATTNNPISARSNTASSGTVQYILNVPKESYTSPGTLDATLSAHNVGNTNDNVAVGSAVNAIWTLKNSSGEVICSGQNDGNLMAVVSLRPGESKVINVWFVPLTDGSSEPLPAGLYTLNVDFSRKTLSLHVSIQ